MVALWGRGAQSRTGLHGKMGRMGRKVEVAAVTRSTRVDVSTGGRGRGNGGIMGDTGAGSVAPG
ncbi:hypothetical protein E2562_022340 [Oryza meyeriana var. granulata]|uniref:DUF834 domain-containing protein n=1 Tax=Oryza meyeriana var. granulata TaxID=110450 RepID=A0A6G1DLD1_9ORYZ|nr:hypothetical protein E2562_022340 [Oryza meyeriana var. granulata]